jgi:myosin-1
VDGVDDAKEFDHTMSAMQAVGLGDKQIHAILNLIAAILHLGNVEFKAKQIDNAEGTEISQQSLDKLSKFCDLINCDINVMKHVLCFRELQTMSPGGKIDTYQVPQNPIQAASRRDALAKSIYERLFDMIVSRINVALDPQKAAQRDGRSSESVDEMLSIGVLDIYGFEIFQNNGFEQLCINYVNEKLQQIFIELTLRAEQDEYKSEGIEWTPIPFFNNRIVCELLDAARPPGIFRILDDTCKTLHAREVATIDRKFIESASQVHSGHAHFSQSSGAIFTIKHYAGDVTYTAGMFGESNKDALNKDMVAAIKQSQDRLIQYLFPEEIDLDDKKAPPTAGTRIRTQCQSLVTALMECSPHYVRCIKSNDQKRALNMDNNRVKHQVKYLGLAENIKVRRAGFAYRAEYHRFFERFNILCKDTYPSWRGSDKDGCIRIVNWICSEKKLPALTQRGEVQYGKSKIFIRQPETYFGLERLRETGLSNFVARIQKAWRSHHNLKEYITLNRGLAKLFADERKTRRKDSIYRPFQGDYLNSLKNHEDIRDDIYKVIEAFSENEMIQFADASCAQVVSDKSGASSKWALSPRIIVLTNEALYLFELAHSAMPELSAFPNKPFPKLFLRRRVSLASGEGLEGIFLTRTADPCIGLSIASLAKPKEPDRSNWAPDSSVNKCGITGIPFSLFTRRHHCRACGGIFTHQACDFAEFVPDRAWDSKSRICDLCIGTFNTAPMEDILIVAARRSEIVSLLRAQYEKFNSKRGKGRGGAELPILFGSTFRMRPSGFLNSSLRPADEINFKEANPPPRGTSKRPPSAPRSRAPPPPPLGSAPWQQALMEESGIIEITLTSVGGRTSMDITCAYGLPHELVEDRRKRQLKRQKAAEARRHAEDEQRRHMAAVKLAEREAERLERLREKKYGLMCSQLIYTCIL